LGIVNPLANAGTPVDPPISEDVQPSPDALESDSDLWTTERVAQYLHVSLKTVFNLRKKGLPYLQLGGAVRFDPHEIKSYLMTNRGLAAHRSRQIVRKGSGA
jgi:excisionase family DNA binding protein